MAVALALWLLYKVLRIAWSYFRRPARLDYHGFAQSRFVDVDGFKIHYVQEGRGPDLLLVHGIASSIYCWRKVFRELARDHRVLALDLPGCGLSDKLEDQDYTLDLQTERLAKFLKKMKLRDVCVIAHSMGGAISAWLTQTHPDLVRGVVFISPALSHKIIFPNPAHFSWFVHLAKKFIVTPSLVRMIYLHLAVATPPADTEEATQQYYLPFHNSPEALVVFTKQTRLLKDPRLTHGLAPFKKPAIILYGRKDRVIAQKYLSQFLKNNPSVHLFTHEKSGHQLMEEDPDFVIQNVKLFFDGPNF